MKNFKGLQIKKDRIILLEKGGSYVIYTDDIPVEIATAIAKIADYTKKNTRWADEE